MPFCVARKISGSHLCEVKEWSQIWDSGARLPLSEHTWCGQCHEITRIDETTRGDWLVKITELYSSSVVSWGEWGSLFFTFVWNVGCSLWGTQKQTNMQFQKMLWSSSLLLKKVQLLLFLMHFVLRGSVMNDVMMCFFKATSWLRPV